MSVYVVEIGGRGIVAFNDESLSEAKQFFDGALQSDLLVLTSEGAPLWNGKSEIFVREAFPDEEGRWKASQARAIKDGEIDTEEAGWSFFLVPVSDPTDE